ncbi:MAG: hypothetical protein ACR2QW_01445 [bacterium]
MQKKLVSEWNTVMKDRFNPLKNMHLASCHYPVRLIVWMWGIIFSLSCMSIYLFDNVWLSQMLSIAGVVITLTIFKISRARPVKHSPAPYLSGASKCVWKMDSEA